MTDLTVVLTHYRRKDNALRILDSLASQTLRPTIFVWDNSPELGLEHSEIDWIVRSNQNTGTSLRWWFASQATTKYVAVQDDDWIATCNKALADVVAGAERVYPYCVGVVGRIFTNNYIPRSVGVNTEFSPLEDVPVDFINGRFFCMPTSRLKSNWEVGTGLGDDLKLSHRFSDGKKSPHLVIGNMHNRWAQLEEGPYSLRLLPDYYQVRQNIQDKYYPNASLF